MSFNNNSSILGRLTADPTINTTNNGKNVCNFTVAVENPFVKDENNRNTADFFDCVAWGKTAETIVQYYKKGYRIGVSGRLHTRMVEHKPKEGNGLTFSIKRTEIMVESLGFIENEASIAAMHGKQTAPAPVPAQQGQSPMPNNPTYTQGQAQQTTPAPAPAQQNTQQAWAAFANPQQNAPAQQTATTPASAPTQQSRPPMQTPAPAPTAQQNWQNNAQQTQDNDNGFYDMNAFSDMDFNNVGSDDFPF